MTDMTSRNGAGCLNLVTGRSGSGKTAHILTQICRKADMGARDLILLVPDQYSHEAERLLCSAGGDGISLHAEVLTFNRLFSRAAAACGGVADRYIDGAGKVLVMRRALNLAAELTEAYAGKENLTDQVLSLLETATECRSARIRPEDLLRLSAETAGGLRTKLKDTATVLEIYQGLLGQDLQDPDERLDRLCVLLDETPFAQNCEVWVDGFRSFTAQQYAVLERLFRKNGALTVTLTLDDEEEDDLLFRNASKTRERLIEMARSAGADIRQTVCSSDEKSDRSPEMAHLEKQLFALQPETAGETERIRLWECATSDEEYEACAAEILALVRKGVRFREIAVAAGDFDSKETLFRSVLERYGIPLYIDRKTDVLQLPPVTALLSALNVLVRGWDHTSVFSYLKTGFAGLTPEECDLLENYALVWNIRGSAWYGNRVWDMNPEGYEESAPDEELLAELGRIRKKVTEPLIRLKRAMDQASDGHGRICALFDFAERIRLYESMEKEAELLRRSGEERLAEDLLSAGEVLTAAAEQFDLTAGDMTCSLREFTELWKLLLSRYSIGAIPSRIDQVVAGDISRIRKRGIRYLFVLGAADNVLPGIPAVQGVFSEEEREELVRLKSGLSESVEDRIGTAQADAYELLTQPSEGLILSCSAEGEIPSRLIDMVRRLFEGLKPAAPDTGAGRTMAYAPCLELSLKAEDGGPYAAAAARVLDGSAEYGAMREKLASSAAIEDQALSRDMVKALYGRKLFLSPSRVERFVSCPFSYFLEYGLKAKKRDRAELTPQVFGTFVHYVLEHTVREVMEKGGFSAVSAEECCAIAERHAEFYGREVLKADEEPGRFRFLFQRSVDNAVAVVREMAEELAVSRFVPVDFELEFSREGDLPPYEVKDGEVDLSIRGKVDRVDSWERDGRLYLRIVDYKTGKKEFTLSDVVEGYDMQMLIYLFALAASGRQRYGKPVVPAGILYSSARTRFVQTSPRPTADEVEKERKKTRKHPGLILDEEDVIRAMEDSDNPVWLPVSRKDGEWKGSLATDRQMDALHAYIDRKLADCGRSILDGGIQPTRKKRKEYENCQSCDYRQICWPEERPVEKVTRTGDGEAWTRIGGETSDGRDHTDE